MTSHTDRFTLELVVYVITKQFIHFLVTLVRSQNKTIAQIYARKQFMQCSINLSRKKTFNPLNVKLFLPNSCRRQIHF